MRILIIEDEERIAKRTQRMATSFFAQRLETLVVCDSLQKGLAYIEKNPIDILLLDLNLNGEDGFDILGAVVAGSFHTIIVSAYTDKAITAFAYGVIDFVPKPFDEERLFQAFRRAEAGAQKSGGPIKYLAIKKSGHIKLIEVNDLLYIKGAGIYSELHLRNGRQELHDKSLEALGQLLPGSFERIHKSYIVPLNQAEKIVVEAGGRYGLLLNNGELLPIGRSRYKELKEKMI